ncbi:type II secretion system F family protein [Umezawaea sp. Da 62-37]|uniref:type II secretion system F family protein n=1 Tax=Umezawaea sp. Da 62-37 TaxID=3075927 RepID=UPI0028F719E5|nr:type II secretion system F family protein [Umezawaea sp. Da 62-37]WNV91720.1 type II secretion system F family protein [Umezawaea sp. Da 62-37]
MTALSLAALATALLVLPAAAATRRLRALRPPDRGRTRGPHRSVAVLACCVLVGLVGGPASLIAAAMIAAVLWRARRSRAVRRSRLAGSATIAAGLAAFVAELKAGAHPAAAAAGAAQDTGEPAATVLTTIASTARLGGDVDTALTTLACARPELAAALGPLARAWRLADSHGVPLADVLDAVRRDLERRVCFAEQVKARMAGPEASAAILAALPAFGVLLGELSGAHPLHVLTSTTPGQVLLVLGALLISGGLLWSAKLTDQAVRS